MISQPIVPGHENVAEVETVGSAVTSWRVGQRVCVEPALSCVPRGIDPPCERCLQGQVSICENVMGGRVPPGLMIGLNPFTGGSWGEYFVAHQSQLHAVPDSVPDEEAVLVDPVACALHAVLRRQPLDEERVLIVGGGFVAMMVAKCLRAVGCQSKIEAIVRHPLQAERMRSAGADEVLLSTRLESTAQRYQRVAARVSGRHVSGYYGNEMLLGGYDVVYDCVGTSRSVTDSMKFARGRGTVVFVGTSGIGVVDTTPIWFSELQILGTNGRQVEDFRGIREHTYDLVFRLLAEGKLYLDGLLSHRFTLRDYPRWLALATGPAAQRPLKAAFLKG